MANGVFGFNPVNNLTMGGRCHPYRKPSRTLTNFQSALEGKPPRFLITRKQGGLGDVLMTLPTVKAIQKKYGAIVDYGTDFDYLDGGLPACLRGIPYINKVIPYNKFEPEDYNLIMDLTCPCVAHEVALAPPVNRIDLFARYLGIALDDVGIDWYLSREEIEWVDNLWDNYSLNQYKIVLISSSSTSAPRDCPKDKIKKAAFSLLSKLDRNVRVVTLTHSTDNEPFNWKAEGFLELRDLPVRKIAAVISKSKLLICPDTGPLHIASALHHPTLTLFGPTDPRARINYHPEAVAIWPVSGLKNYPHWYEPSIDRYACWSRMDENMITQVAYSMINNKPIPVHPDIVAFPKAQRVKSGLVERL